VEIYQVKSGDTLSQIALDVLGDASMYPKIMQLNNMVETTIYPGQQLLMPDPEVLGPVVVPRILRRGEPVPAPAPAAAPAQAGIAFGLDTETIAYLALGAALLFLAMGKK
jgi:LysM repeat protein